MDTMMGIFQPKFLLILAGALFIGFIYGYTLEPSQAVYEHTLEQSKQNQNKDENQKINQGEQIIVKKGDTLWKIAEKHFPNQPVDQVILYLKKLNNLPNDHIKVGDSLRLS
jgi:LysM repeat protein